MTSPRPSPLLLALAAASATCATIAGVDDDFVLGASAGGAHGGAAAQSSTGSGAAGNASGGAGAQAAGVPGGSGGVGAATGGVGGVGATGGLGGTGGAGGQGATGGSGGDPLADVAASLDGARVELPCNGHTSVVACTATSASAQRTVGGQAGATYDVVVRVRGVVEQNHYVGGTADGSFYTGGQADNAGWNVHRITIAEPAEHHFVNQGQTGILNCFPLDYQATIRVRAGSLVTLDADGLDGQQVQNIDGNGIPIVVDGIPPAPSAYDGQFFQLDVVGVSLVP